MDFLARLLMHIPEPRLHTVRYYGEYSSVVRARRRAEAEGIEAERVARDSRRRIRRAVSR